MTKRIYVGNLPKSIDENKLKELFNSYGNITEVEIIKDKKTGEIKGFAFISFEEELSAEKAIAEMNKKSVGENEIIVKEAYPKRSFKGKGFKKKFKGKKGFGKKPGFKGKKPFEKKGFKGKDFKKKPDRNPKQENKKDSSEKTAKKPVEENNKFK